ncbi:hypothetical protein V8C34DRAFT_273457 [Trichoderma compactum]
MYEHQTHAASRNPASRYPEQGKGEPEDHGRRGFPHVSGKPISPPWPQLYLHNQQRPEKLCMLVVVGIQSWSVFCWTGTFHVKKGWVNREEATFLFLFSLFLSLVWGDYCNTQQISHGGRVMAAWKLSNDKRVVWYSSKKVKRAV